MSMTKPFTGVAAMMLVEEGKLELHRPISDYLPEFQGQVVEERLPNGNTITRPPLHPPMVWQLMCHTSGLGENPDGELKRPTAHHARAARRAVRFYGTRHLQFEPGTRWRYSNMGLATLAASSKKSAARITFTSSRATF